MSETSENNKRIAKNTIYLYIRMLGLMLISLYTSRVILSTLGVEDFGIYNVVAGFVTILAFFNSSLANASQRYLSIGLGENDVKATSRYFRQSMSLMLCFSLVAFLLGETVGLWFVENKLVIPENRKVAAFWVYQFSLISTIISINEVSFIANIVARERMGIYAYVAIFEAVSKLIIVYLLQCLNSFDQLILYGFLTLVVTIMTFMLYVCYCKKHFAEVELRLYWDSKIAKSMGKFIAANLYGCLAWSAGVQGTNVVLNMFFGPIVNAARGIAVQINGVAMRFTDNVMTAIKPQIIKSYASNDIGYMKSLIVKSTKYMAAIAILISMPLMFETNTIISCWLGQTPEYSISFVRLVLCEQFISVLISPLWVAANATGNIKRTQVYGRTFTLLSLPIAYCLLLFFPNPLVPLVVLVITNFIYWIYCIYDIKIQIDLNLIHYFKYSILPAMLLAASLAIICLIVNVLFHEESILRFIATLSSVVVFGSVICYKLSDRGEKVFVKNLILRYLKHKTQNNNT